MHIKYCVKKNITGQEKEKYKIRFRGEKGIFVIEKLTRGIIECYKLPEVINNNRI